MSGSNRYRLTQQPATSARYCHQLIGVDRQHHTRRRQRLRNIPFCAPTHHPKYLPPTGGANPRYRPAPACQGIAPRRAGTSLYPHIEELFLAKQVKACTGLPRNNSSASWYKLVAARQ
ncbi:hypothetical protein PCANC_28605 [Puccinia coronata f. sp. avenae]|uniref:Uncharacterized protein n=1 Tax=Puccinia coronata f. sp. avenae TaxID=200324 RepID=A0A2N5TIP2_9BASI|nr:hypothetical protein PCANC_28605 [Puccinia coronata f. sp. avenae]